MARANLWLEVFNLTPAFGRNQKKHSPQKITEASEAFSVFSVPSVVRFSLRVGDTGQVLVWLKTRGR